MLIPSSLIIFSYFAAQSCIFYEHTWKVKCLFLNQFSKQCRQTPAYSFWRWSSHYIWDDSDHITDFLSTPACWTLIRHFGLNLGTEFPHTHNSFEIAFKGTGIPAVPQLMIQMKGSHCSVTLARIKKYVVVSNEQLQNSLSCLSKP